MSVVLFLRASGAHEAEFTPSLVRGHLVVEPDCSPANIFYLTNEDEVADTSLVRYIRAGGVKERFSCSAELQEHMTLTEENLLSAPIEDIFADCDAYGIGDRTARRAAKELGVISRSKDGVTTWELPSD